MSLITGTNLNQDHIPLRANVGHPEETLLDMVPPTIARLTWLDLLHKTIPCHLVVILRREVANNHSDRPEVSMVQRYAHRGKIRREGLLRSKRRR